MSTTDTTSLPDYAPVPQSAIGPTLGEQGYFVGRVERNLYCVTDGSYQCAFLTTSDGVVLLDAPPSLGHDIQRAVEEIAQAYGVSNKVNYLIYSHHHADHVGASSLFDSFTGKSIEQHPLLKQRSEGRFTPLALAAAPTSREQPSTMRQPSWSAH